MSMSRSSTSTSISTSISTSALNNAHVERCKSLASVVEKLSQMETDELFKIIHTRHQGYTRNNNGIFLNLTWLDEETLCCIEDYVKFCSRSRTELQKFESLCDVLSRTNASYQQTTSCNETTEPSEKQQLTSAEEGVCMSMSMSATMLKGKLSSSGRYALYKKRFAKQNQDTKDVASDLKTEGYICT